jgi:fructose-1,6-bisphosphatase/inositol monophosphatase family enzyme
MEGSGKNITSINFSNTDTLAALRDKGIKTFKFLSIIYGGVQVANGKFSGSIFFGVHGHDVASTKIIVEEAGGKVTDLLGNDRRYDEKGLGCVASNGRLHAELLNCIKQL